MVERMIAAPAKGGAMIEPSIRIRQRDGDAENDNMR